MSRGNQNFSTVDIFAVASNRQKINTTVAVSEMPELIGLIINSEKVLPFDVRIEGTEGVRGLPGAILTISGHVQMRCTRCTQPIDIEIDREVPFLFVHSEAEANRIPIEEDEEWEVSLPTFPRHDDCHAPENHTSSGQSEEEITQRPKPFANLRDLLKKN